MTIEKLTSGVDQNDPSASTGREVAAAVNALIDACKYNNLSDSNLSAKSIKTMQSPPTVTISTTNSLSAGQRWAATNNSNTGSQLYTSGAFSVFRGGYYDAGPSFPRNQSIIANDITGALVTSQVSQVSFIYTGATFSAQLFGAIQVLIKVNDEFVSLTPVTSPADGNYYYLNVDFSSVEQRRIDLIMVYTRFGGIWTGLTDVIRPAPRRGIKSFVMSDSFGEGVGNEVGQIWSWVTYLAEFLGWDDVTASAVGGTGLIATPGAPKVPYRQRIQHDVLDLMPDGEKCLLWISLSINDSSYTSTQIADELNLLLDVVDSSGKNPIIVISSPTINRGIGSLSTNSLQQNSAAKQVAEQRGCIFIDDIGLGLNDGFPLTSTTTTGAVSANATSVSTAIPLIMGATYEFDDGTSFFVRSVAGSTATVDKIAVAQLSGATVSLRGSCYLTGTGRVGATAGWGVCDLAVSADGVHPTNLGHKLKASSDAERLLSVIVESSNT